MIKAATRVGLFVTLGVALLAAALVWVGGRWFDRVELAHMTFTGSVYGLRTGAPVVFRGVTIGSVSEIAVPALDSSLNGLRTPGTAVTARIEVEQLQRLRGQGDAVSGPLLPWLVQQGVVARLASQSLLTGLLYVDLELQGAPTAAEITAAQSAAGRPSGTTVIPTLAAAPALDLGQVGQELAELARAMRGILEDPAARGLPAAGLASLQSLQAAARRIEQEVAMLAPPGREVLVDARRALQSLPGAAREVGAAAVQAQATVRGADETLQRIGRAADELGQGAAALRGLAAPDSNTRKSLQQTADEIQRAARAVRELAQQLQQRPQSLIWGPGPERTER